MARKTAAFLASVTLFYGMGFRELALFAGSGGGILASRLLGWETVVAVEIEPFCRARIHQRIDEGHLDWFPIWDDIETFDARSLRGRIDVVSGGFPCQPFSTASRGRKVAVDLWPQMRRVVEECEPRFVFAENVQQKPIERAAQDLAGLGYVVRCARIGASALGAPHRRVRHWLVATDADHEGQCPEPQHAKMASLRRASGLGWRQAPSPRILGAHDGLAGRLDRMRAVGNGQVPSVAAFAWLFLSSDERSE